MSRNARRWICRWIPIGAILLMASMPAHAAVGTILQFTGKTVTASRLRQGGAVVFFGVAKIPLRYNWRIVRWQEVLTDDDHDGVITFAVDQAIPASSMWAVIDLQTGEGT